MEKNVLQFLERTALKYSGKTAVKDNRESVTFSELEYHARLVGSGLARHICSGAAIPVYLEKGIKTLVAFLGIVYAGGCYSLLAPIQPEERCNNILQKLDAPVLVTDREHLKKARTFVFQGKILLIEELLESTLWEEKLVRIREDSTDWDPLYINFTSGSTGIPKGVVVRHGSVINFIRHFAEIFHITSEDTIGNQAPFDFDVSVKDIYSMLLTGATLYLIPRECFSFAKQLLDELDREQITVLIWAVSALCLITSLNGFAYKIPSSVKKVLFSGEVMPMKHLLAWKRALPGAMFVNLYGPTEITCNCSYYVIPQDISEGDTLPIGRHFPNVRILLLGENDRLIMGEGETGELCVSGFGLALGYYGDMEKTDSVFIQNPLNTKYRDILYRTGDLAYYRKDGELIYVGRRDTQIKHMGHRIEMGEIENCILQNPGVKSVCCLYDDVKQQIVCFYQGNADGKEIRDGLRKKLIKYMIPGRYILLEQMPLNANGKTDRKTLRQIYIDTVDAESNGFL